MGLVEISKLANSLHQTATPVGRDKLEKASLLIIKYINIYFSNGIKPG